MSRDSPEVATATAYPQPPSTGGSNGSRDAAIEIARLQERVTGLYILLDEREKQLRTAFEASEKANEKAEVAQRQVNATQNEFRGALKDQAGTFATKGELDTLKEGVLIRATHAEVEAVKDRVLLLEKADAVGAGRHGGMSAIQAFIFQLLPLLISALALIAFFVKK